MVEGAVGAEMLARWFLRGESSFHFLLFHSPYPSKNNDSCGILFSSINIIPRFQALVAQHTRWSFLQSMVFGDENSESVPFRGVMHTKGRRQIHLFVQCELGVLFQLRSPANANLNSIHLQYSENLELRHLKLFFSSSFV